MRFNTVPVFLGLIFSLVFLAPLDSHAQTETINTSLCGCQPGAGTPCPGNTNFLMCTFAINITGGCPSFTAINNFTTSGTYAATDILNFKLYETNFSVFNTSTLVATINTGLGPGAHSFTGFNRTTCAAAQRYYWITCDFAPAAVAGNTIRINLITAAMYAITGTLSYGTNTAAGMQTICNTLPVSLISFAGKTEEGKNVLRWETASETNNDYFTLERSDDGISFSPLAIRDGAGTTSELSSYSAIDDRDYYSPVTYYRLRQTDFDGHYEYVGGIVTIHSEPRSQPVNIVVTESSLHVRQQEGELCYTIFDLSGRNCRSGTLSAGETEISLEGLPAGAYILRLDDRSQTTKFFNKIWD